MRHKISIETKLENLESKIKKIGFYIKNKEEGKAYEGVGVLLEDIEDIRSLLRNESQD